MPKLVEGLYLPKGSGPPRVRPIAERPRQRAESTQFAGVGKRRHWPNTFFPEEDAYTRQIRGASTRIGNSVTDPLADVLTDETLIGGFDSSIEAINAFAQQQQDAINNAMGQLDLTEADYNDIFGQFRSYLDALPTNPYSDQLKEENITRASDDIVTEIADLNRQGSQSRSSRGFGVGGGSSSQYAQLQGAGIQARTKTLNDINNEALRINTETGLAKGGLLNELTGAESTARGNIGGLRAQLARGNVIDPELTTSIIGDTTSAQIGIDQARELIELARESGNPDLLSRVLTFVGQSIQGLNTARGRPLQALFGNAIAQTPWLIGGNNGS